MHNPHLEVQSVFEGSVVLAYDVFYSRRNNCVCLIAPGDPEIDFEGIECVFDERVAIAGEKVEGCDDAECHVRTTIHTFAIPDGLAGRNEARVTIRTGNRVFHDRLPLSLDARALDVPRFKLAAVLLFKDEQPFLAQWLDYHLLLGVEHFYLYDNNSVDRRTVLEVLQPYINRGVVTHIPWDFPYKYAEISATFTQAGAINHWLYKFGHRADWMTHIDVDEYIFPPNGRADSLVALLGEQEADATIGSLILRWCWFGNSGFKQMPPGRIIENFVWRQALNYDAQLKRNQNKLIVRSEAVEILNYHYVTLHKSGRHGAGVDPSRLRLNHYAAITYRGRIKKRRHNEERDLGMLPLAAELDAKTPMVFERKITRGERMAAETRRWFYNSIEKVLPLARRGRGVLRKLTGRSGIVLL